MNKKGFTLIELLAVIAILAILMVFIAPKVIKTFNDSRRETFRIEVMNIYDAGIKERTKDIISEKDLTNEYRSNGTLLSLNANKKIKYVLKFDSTPKGMKYICVSNGEYKILIDYQNEMNIITKDNIQNVAVENTNISCIDDTETEKPVVIPAINNNEFIAASSNSMYLDNEGKIWVWGSNYFGELGINSLTPQARYTPQKTLVDSSISFKRVSADQYISMAISNEGKIYSWGMNDLGQLGNGNTNSLLVPTPISITGNPEFDEISVGGYHTLVLDTEGNIWSWGKGQYGELGIGVKNTSIYPTPQKIQMNDGIKFKKISAGSGISMALSTTGDIYMWGHNYLEGTDETNILVPTKIELTNNIKFKAITCEGMILALSEEGDIYNWNNEYVTGTTYNISVEKYDIPNNVKFKSISSNFLHALAIDTENNLWGFGNNEDGQLGNGSSSSIEIESPTKIELGNLKFKAIECGFYYSIGVTLDDEVYSWGAPGNGSLGYSSKTNVLTPTLVTIE